MKKGQTRPQDFFNLNRHVVIAGLEKKAIEKDQDRVTRAEYKQNQATKERQQKICQRKTRQEVLMDASEDSSYTKVEDLMTKV